MCLQLLQCVFVFSSFESSLFADGSQNFSEPVLTLGVAFPVVWNWLSQDKPWINSWSIL